MWGPESSPLPWLETVLDEVKFYPLRRSHGADDHCPEVEGVTYQHEGDVESVGFDVAVTSYRLSRTVVDADDSRS